MNSPIYDSMKNDSYGRIDSERLATVDVDQVTPNVTIENPNTRRKLTSVVGVIGAVLGTVIVVDLASPAFDLSAYTEPITAGFLYLASYYGIAVTLPNTPKRNA